MCRLMTPQLEKALKPFPLYSQDGKAKEAICCAVFALGAVRWYILEGETQDGDTIMYGIVIGLFEDEYGYVSLNELSEVQLDLRSQGLGRLQVEQVPHFRPKAISKVADYRLQDFLARFSE